MSQVGDPETDLESAETADASGPTDNASNSGLAPGSEDLTDEELSGEELDSEDSDEEFSDEEFSDEEFSDEDDGEGAEDLPIEPHAILETEAQPIHLRIHLDPVRALAIQDQFRLFSVSGDFEQIRTSADDKIVGDEYIDLVFGSVPSGQTYSLEVSGEDHEPYLLFENVTFDAIDGYYEDDPLDESDPLEPEDPEEYDPYGLADPYGLDSSTTGGHATAPAGSAPQPTNSPFAATPASTATPTPDGGTSGINIDLGVAKVKISF